MESIQNASLIVAAKTPYESNGEIDLTSYDQLIENLIQNGVQGVVVGGSTGEGHLMEWDEHIMLIAHTVNRFNSRIIVIGNTGSNNTAEAIKATKQGFAVGMHAALQINPYYGKTSDAGLLAHFEKVLELGPAIIYNVPTRTNQEISTTIMETIAKHENMIGVKECMKPERIAYYEKKGIACWSGNEDTAHESRHSCNSHGVISVAGNIIPRTIRNLMDTRNDQLNNQMQPFFDWLFCEPNPIPLNTIMAMMDLIKPVFRLPYVPLDLEQRKAGIKILESLDLDDAKPVVQVLSDSDFRAI